MGKTELIDKVNHLAIEYKKNENEKIIQIFHITVVVILGILNIVKNDYKSVLCLLIAFVLIGLAYFYFYLADINNSTAQTYYYVLEHNEIKEENNAIISRFKNISKNGIYCRNMCAMCTILCHIFIWLAFFFGFDLMNLSLGLGCIIALAVVVLIIIGLFGYAIRQFCEL